MGLIPRTELVLPIEVSLAVNKCQKCLGLRHDERITYFSNTRCVYTNVHEDVDPASQSPVGSRTQNISVRSRLSLRD